jgi:hypothetical protein
MGVRHRWKVERRSRRALPGPSAKDSHDVLTSSRNFTGHVEPRPHRGSPAPPGHLRLRQHFVFPSSARPGRTAPHPPLPFTLSASRQLSRPFCRYMGVWLAYKHSGRRQKHPTVRLEYTRRPRFVTLRSGVWWRTHPRATCGISVAHGFPVGSRPGTRLVPWAVFAQLPRVDLAHSVTDFQVYLPDMSMPEVRKVNGWC